MKPTLAARTRSQWLYGWLGMGWLAGVMRLMAQDGGIPGEQGIKKFECGMAVATCFSRGQLKDDGNTASCLPRPSLPEGYVVGIMDLRNPAANGAVPLANWMPNMTHNETGAPPHQWRASNLGEVFGIALDDQSPPNIYVASTSIYPGEFYAPGGGPGAVYRIDGTTFQISQLIQFKDVGTVSLGNLCYDPDHQQIFIADLDNGWIRRVSLAGVELSKFDHGVAGRVSAAMSAIPDTSTFSSLTDAGRRVFAVQYHGGRVYYSVWDKVTATGPGPGANTIWSVGLLPNGDFATGPNAARVELSSSQLPWNPVPSLVPAPNIATQASVVTDIAFSSSGRMATAERGLCFDDPRNLNTFAHFSPAREFQWGGATWSETTAPNGMNIGNSTPGHNSEGGIDYDCDSHVYVTGDLYVPNNPLPPFIYGVEILATATNAFNTAFLVDLDGSVANFDKSYLGDVEVYRCCDCIKFSNETVQCLATNQIQWNFCFTNHGTLTNGHLVFIDLPPGVTVNPPVVDLVPAVKPGQGMCTNVTFNLPANFNAQTLCFRVAAHTPDYADCCVVSKCLEVPVCCAQFPESKVECSKDGTGVLTWNFSLLNQSGQTIQYLYLDAQPGCISPGFKVLTLNPPLANGQTLTTNLSFVSTNHCDQVCFRVSLHDTNFVNCCSFKYCLRLPDCGGAVGFPDDPVDLPGALKINPTGATVLSVLAPVDVPVAILQPEAVVRQVALWVNGGRTGQASFPARTLRLGTLAPGTYQVAIESTFDSGAVTLSQPITLIVKPEIPPGVLQIDSAGDGLELKVQTVAGEKCWVESATQLIPGDWSTTETLTGDGRVWRQKVPSGNPGVRFYRVRME